MQTSLQKFSVNGIEIHYLKSGKGQPLLFVPGSISDYRTWSGVSTQFENQNECYVLSRRFTYPGKYPSNGDSRVEVNASDLAEFVRGLKLAPVRVIGHSYGAYIALCFAIHYPELVESVVAEEPVFVPALVKNPKNPLQLLGLLFRNFKAGISFARLGAKGIEPTFKYLAAGDLVSAQKTFIDGVTEGKKTPETLDSLTRQQLADNIAALAGEDPFRTNLRMSDVRKISCPVTLVYGTQSPYVFQYICLRLHNYIERSVLKRVTGAAHWVHLDKTAEFVEAVRTTETRAAVIA